MRTVNTLLHRWQGYSGRNPFLWIEPPKILALQCILYFCHSALYHLNVRDLHRSHLWGFNLRILPSWLDQDLLYQPDSFNSGCPWSLSGTGSRSLESFLESQQRPGRTSKKSATQKCQKHFSNNLRRCVVPQRWHCILFRTGTQAWKLNPSCGFQFEWSFSSVCRPAYSSSNHCSSTVMS